MAQHLLAAADLYGLDRLRKMCERRLFETVDLETACTTLALADANHADVSGYVLVVWGDRGWGDRGAPPPPGLACL
jgi:hypothetical protein